MDIMYVNKIASKGRVPTRHTTKECPQKKRLEGPWMIKMGLIHLDTGAD
jgi:hypothetical protein